MDKITRNLLEDSNTAAGSMSTVTRLAHQLTSSISSVFSSQPHRRSSANVVPCLESLENRTMMSVNPIAEICTAEDHAHNEALAEQEGPITIVDRQTPLELARKTPHFQTDYLDVSPENPVTIQAKYTFHQADSYPSIIIAKNGNTDHRNGLREAIYVQARREGLGVIQQFLGSDDNRNTIFSYDELRVGDTVDVEVTYDGTSVTVSISHDGTALAHESFTPPIAYSSPKFGESNMHWGQDTITATSQSFTVTQGKKRELIDCVTEAVAESPTITAAIELLDTEQRESPATEQQPIEVFALEDPIGLARKTPHFLTDHTDVSVEDPIHVRAQATFEH
ncbi:MAG: hypothetical protein O3A81_04455, partial [bacterium]|nr:hypothetical protein [bacterium]